ncbi:hypothetical protein NQ176_g10156 [Zarea fungicola]|uniref:Uncharacterized protein n=1 Tax=Zarea fungicola TaxID=93591 RepID=A0ACC1MJB0_9HYPO|nr:hypothetical protein NQ176_g10156 [Lecanicillium fungicola]
MDIFATTSESHLRAILVGLCNDRKTRAKAVDLAKKLAETPSATPSGSDLSICGQCNQAFSLLADTKGQCRYHPGEMEVDWQSDTWADTEEETWGPTTQKRTGRTIPMAFSGIAVS